MPDHEIVPHYNGGVYLADGLKPDWTCFAEVEGKRCGQALVGSFLKPVIPWRHRGDPLPLIDETRLPGLTTTE